MIEDVEVEEDSENALLMRRQSGDGLRCVDNWCVHYFGLRGGCNRLSLMMKSAFHRKASPDVESRVKKRETPSDPVSFSSNVVGGISLEMSVLQS